MGLHQTTDRWRLGAGLALVTVTCWGALPIVMMVLLRQLDAYTATWFRFVVASAVLGLILKSRRVFPTLKGLSLVGCGMLVVSTLGLAGNYLTYLQSLAYISPGTAQVMIQVAPFLFILSSVVIFRERFSRYQLLGLVFLVAGLAFFFHHRVHEIFDAQHASSLGMILILVAAVTWVLYAVAQKQLLTVLSSQGILFFIYFGSALLFTPVARIQPLLDLDGLGWGLLIFASLNTVVAYGAFSEAMRHLDASRVSAILSLTPIASLVCVAVAAMMWPDIVPSENLPALSYVGAFFVVAGSMLAALGVRRPVPAPVIAKEVLQTV